MKCIKNRELIISFSYLVVTIYFMIKDAIFYTNIINPIFWGIVFLYLIRNVKIRFSANKRQIIPIIGIETLRIVVIAKNKKNKLLVTIITILLILLQINYHIFGDLYLNKEELFRYVCSTIIPIIICNIIYTYFILKNMHLFVLGYRVLGKLFVLLVPALPNVDWYVMGSVGILLPAFMYLLFRYKFSKEKKDIRERKENFLEKFYYAVTFIFALMLVCFMIGMFKYEPICILSNSMIPTYKRGDVVIFKKMNNYELNNIQKNSIIIYEKDDKNIAHRVVNVIKTDDNVLYQTKGDSNNMSDTDLVQIAQIKGVYVFHIKYIGLPSVWLYNYFHQEEINV